MEPEFTPEDAKEAVAIVLLAYLAAKNGKATKREELNKYAVKNDTKLLLENLNEVTQQNYKDVHWEL